MASYLALFALSFLYPAALAAAGITGVCYAHNECILSRGRLEVEVSQARRG